jgi:hypothetical protein
MKQELVVLALSLAGAACSDRFAPRRCDDIDVEEVENSIFGGRTFERYLSLNDEMANAVGTIQINARERTATCTGFLIGARWGATAAHCQPHAGEPIGEWLSGAGIEQSEAIVAIRRWVIHPELDLALVELSDDVAGASPVGFSRQDPTLLIGQRAEISGFGVSEVGRGLRRFAVVRISAVTDTLISTASISGSGACVGDSGGPLLIRDETGRVVSLGVLSRGSAACNQIDEFSRLDGAYVWLMTTSGVVTPTEASCGRLSYNGRCFSGVAMWCADNHLEVDPCREGLTCGWSRQAAGFRCVAQDPCEGVDNLGACVGAELRRCISGHAAKVSCASCGMACRERSFDGTSECILPDPF